MKTLHEFRKLILKHGHVVDATENPLIFNKGGFTYLINCEYAWWDVFGVFPKRVLYQISDEEYSGLISRLAESIS